MLQSMTGYGEAQHDAEGISFVVEIKSLNNRFLKSSIKLPDALAYLEPHIEHAIRARLSRGSVTCTVHMRYTGEEGALDLNRLALRNYVAQLHEAIGGEPQQADLTIDLATLAQLPGVCQPREYSEAEHEQFLKLVSGLTDQALDALAAMRTEEGKSLFADLQANCQVIRDNLKGLGGLTDLVVQNYRDRIEKRVNALLAEAKLEIDQDTLAREVAIFAERCDVNEEISRLGSHLDQFLDACRSGEQIGRRLDFLTQEMLREANTIGSKANDSQISQHVVNIKVAIDRLKEQVQNVE